MRLRIVDDIVAMVGRVHRHSRVVARQDRNLARQTRDAATSVGMNAGEGLRAQGGNRTVRLESAMAGDDLGTRGHPRLRIAGAAGYLAEVTVAREVDEVDRIVATWHKLAYRGS